MSKSNPTALITCICGSVRFKEQMLEVARYLELDKGRIVVMPNVYSKIDGIKLNKSELDTLVAVHDQKIKMADGIYVVDAPGNDGQPYIGESTTREIQLAETEGKPIEFLSKDEKFRDFHESFQKRMLN